MTLKAFAFHPVPSLRTTVVIRLHPSFFKMDKLELKRFGNLPNKIKSYAEDLTGGRLHHYKITD